MAATIISQHAQTLWDLIGPLAEKGIIPNVFDLWINDDGQDITIRFDSGMMTPVCRRISGTDFLVSGELGQYIIEQGA